VPAERWETCAGAPRVAVDRAAGTALPGPALMLLRRLRARYARTTLQTKFALHVVSSTTALFAVLIPLVLYVQQRALVSAVERSGLRIADIFARSSVQAVVADDYLIMQHVVNGIASDSKVVYAMLLREDGEVLVHSTALERGKRYADPVSLQAAAARAPLVQSDVPTRVDGRRVYDFAVPVWVLGDKRAVARVGLSIEEELRQVSRTRNWSLAFGAVVLVVGLGWAAFQARRVTRPVQTLVQGTREIARGNLAHRIPVDGADELGQLAAALNRMTDSVQALIETSRELSSTLEPAAVLRSVAAHAQALVKADGAVIALYDREAGEARVEVALGGRTGLMDRLVIRPGQGLGGAVLCSGRPMVSARYLEDPRIEHTPRYDAVARAEGIVTMAAVPITLRGEITGLLFVANRTERLFSDEDVDALERMARQAAIAIENARLYAETRLKSARLEGLLRVSRAVTATLDPREIVEVALRAVGDLMPGSVVRLWVVAGSGDVLVPHGGAASEGEAGGLAVPVGSGLVGAVAAGGQPVVVEDLGRDPRRAPGELEVEGLVAFLGLPLAREGRLLGVLAVATRVPHRFARDEIELFASFAQQAAIALENARLYQELKTSHERLLEAQDELVRTTRLAAIGEIAAAVAHETRNPLGALSNCVQLLRGSSALGGEDAELLEILQAETRRLNQLVSDFLAFGRPRPPRFEQVDLREVVEATLAALRRDDRCAPGIAIVTKADPVLPAVRADRDQLRQVFWNLFLNAVQAMGTEGELTVELRALGDQVELAVRDTGPGIPPSALARLFEPFYTTRAAGTGLGLAIVHRVVQEHGGRIRVESEPGVGTCFVLSLPAHPSP